MMLFNPKWHQSEFQCRRYLLAWILLFDSKLFQSDVGYPSLSQPKKVPMWWNTLQNSVHNVQLD